METFTPPRPFITHQDYRRDRERTLQNLSQEILKNAIDPPLLPLVQECISIPHCFTLQCCYGHFVHRLAPDLENLVPISSIREPVGPIRYRIAYLVLCIENSRNGRSLYHDLAGMTEMDLMFIQFGSADWFWDQMPNTYCIQLEPERLKEEDSGLVSWEEALRIEELRTPFFAELVNIMHRHRVQGQ
jgi:hypothetical protein